MLISNVSYWHQLTSADNYHQPLTVGTSAGAYRSTKALRTGPGWGGAGRTGPGRGGVGTRRFWAIISATSAVRPAKSDRYTDRLTPDKHTDTARINGYIDTRIYGDTEMPSHTEYGNTDGHTETLLQKDMETWRRGDMETRRHDHGDMGTHRPGDT